GGNTAAEVLGGLDTVDCTFPSLPADRTKPAAPCAPSPALPAAPRRRPALRRNSGTRPSVHPSAGRTLARFPAAAEGGERTASGQRRGIQLPGPAARPPRQPRAPRPLPRPLRPAAAPTGARA
ncbi:hypothetical protein P7K49_008812, partial [Saguinus oedipus]